MDMTYRMIREKANTIWSGNQAGHAKWNSKCGGENIIKTDGKYKDLSVCVLGMSGWGQEPFAW